MFSRNKLFVILSVFLILVIFSFSSSFASTYEFEGSTIITNDTYDNEYTYKFIFFTDNETTAQAYIFYSNTEIFVDERGFTSKNNGTYRYTELSCWSRDLPSTFDFSNVDISSYTESGSTSMAYFDNGKFFYSNYNIKDIDGNLVFQVAPVTVEQVTIPEIQQVGEIPQAIAEVLKILIPIGLIVLSIGLVIYLTRLVISRLQ